MGAGGVGHHGRGQVGGVVRAEEVRRGVGQCDVDQRFVLDARQVLLVGPLRPDHLGDDPDAPVDVRPDERAEQGAEDAAGVAAGHRHVVEADPAGFGGGQAGAQVFEVGVGHRDQHLLVAGDAVADEAQHIGDVAVAVVVEVGVVPQAGGRGGT